MTVSNADLWRMWHELLDAVGRILQSEEPKPPLDPACRYIGEYSELIQRLVADRTQVGVDELAAFEADLVDWQRWRVEQFGYDVSAQQRRRWVALLRQLIIEAEPVPTADQSGSAVSRAELQRILDGLDALEAMNAGRMRTLPGFHWWRRRLGDVVERLIAGEPVSRGELENIIEDMGAAGSWRLEVTGGDPYADRRAWSQDVFRRVITAGVAGEPPNLRPLRLIIRQRRLAARLTQAEVANKLGVDSMTVSRWERGGQEPGAALRRQLADVLGGKPNDYTRKD